MYIPTHAEDFALAFETPNILRQLCSVLIPFMPKAHQVVRIMLFKRCLGRTYIYFSSTGAVRFYSCFIHNLVGKAMPTQRTLFRLAAITAPRLAAALLSCLTYMVYTGFSIPVRIRVRIYGLPSD